LTTHCVQTVEHLAHQPRHLGSVVRVHAPKLGVSACAQSAGLCCDYVARELGRSRVAPPEPATGLRKGLSSVRDRRIGGARFVVSACTGRGLTAPNP
jgi:hypothetical protein